MISFIWPLNRTLTGTTTAGKSWPESNGNEVVLQIPLCPRTKASPFVGLVSYSGHLLGESYPSVVILNYKHEPIKQIIKN